MSQSVRDILLAAATEKKLPRETLEIPELGLIGDKAAIVQAMSGTERDAWETSLIVGRGKRRKVDTENVRAKLACRSLVDDKGERLFTDGEAVLIGNLPASILNRIYEVAQRLSGISDEDVDELKKASEVAAGSGSPTN